MANEIEYEAGAPKKADVLIRSTQHIAIKQEEMSEQLKLAVSRIEEALDQFTKNNAGRIEEVMEQFTQNNQDSSYVVKQSGELFSQLQSENAVLKQELLYLAKQSENIYAGLAEKITELTEKFKSREDSLNGMADKVNDVATQAVNNSDLMDRLAEISERSKRNEDTFDTLAAKITALSEKLDTVAERTLKSERAINEKLSADRSESSDTANADVMSKLNHIAEQLRRSEGAHSMLADKFEILSMRVEQFGFESAKPTPANYQHTVQPVAYPAPMQTVVKQDLDYDMLANKVADLLSAREAISPDYIASKVAEQIIVPEIQASQVKLNIDTNAIARQVADYVNVKPVAGAPANVAVNIDEEALAERIASKVSMPSQVVASPSNVAVNIDEEALANRIAGMIGGVKTEGVAVSSLNIDTDELVDAIALKVGSLKSEDFEILVDDEGCTSISKEIANKLDYKFISDVVANKIRDALDLAAANAPDYEDMAERISEKITVAGINEDAIADKAAAVLSNYLPEFDVDEIADKVTGAVIDVVSAMPQPTLDSEAICNTITERLIESQEDHDYDIVIDDEGISRITELVSEQIETKTVARFEKVEDQLTKLGELLTPEEAEEVEEEVKTEEEVAAADEKDYTAISELMAEEIEKSTAHRFDKVEEDIAKLAELVSGITVEEQPEDVEYEEEYEGGEPDYAKLSEVVAAEIEKGVASRFESVEENIAKLTELMTYEEEEAEEQLAEEEATEVEEDYTKISEAVAAEVEKVVAAQIDGVREDIGKLAELVSNGVETEIIEEAGEQDYTKLSEVVAAEIEKGVTARLDTVEENIGKLTELVSSGVETEIIEEPAEQDYTALTQSVVEEVEKAVAARLESVEQSIAKLTELVTVDEEQTEQPAEPDYTGLSQSLAEEVEKTVATRLDGVEENIAKLAELVANGVKIEQDGQPSGVDFTDLSRIVAAEMLRGLDSRLEKVESDLGKLTDYVEGDMPVETDSRIDKIAEDLGRISTFMEGELSVETAARLQKLEEEIANISEAVKEAVKEAGAANAAAEAQPVNRVEDDIAQIKDMLASGVLVKESAADMPEVEYNRLGKFEEDLAEIKEMLANGVRVNEATAAETAATQAAAVEEVEEEEPLVTVSDVVEEPAVKVVKEVIVVKEQPEEEEEFEEEEEEEDDDDDDKDDDFLIDVLDMDGFSDNELMPGEMSDYAGGVDFENMMKFKRSFIARIIQSRDEYKQYYGEVKHALLSYKKVNSNVAWSNERFNKGRETIARMKIRGKTLVIYLALDPNNYKTSVYHHIDVSDNKSVAGTPMMIKVKSNLGVKKAIRLIDEMLALRNGEKKEIPERDYAAMYPYETIEELIEEGLVKDVRKK